MFERKSGVLWLLTGLGIGVAVGMLFAPGTGEDTRDYLQAKTEESADYVREQSKKMRKKAKDLAEGGRDIIDQKKQGVHSAGETVIEVAEPIVENLQSH